MPSDTPRRLDALMENMRTRLRPLCADWPEEVFNDMVKSLAEITMRYEGKAITGLYDRRATEGLRGELRTMLDATDEASEEK